MKKMTGITIAAIAASSGLASAGFDATFNFAASELVSQAIHIVWATAGTHTNQSDGATVNHAAGDLIGNYAAGHLAYDYTNGTDGSADNGLGQFESGRFSSFCIELQSIATGPRSYTVENISDAPNPDGPSGTPSNDPLFGGPAYDAADQAEVEAVIAAAVRLHWIFGDLSKDNATRTQLAAIQGLIWKRLFDNAVVTGNGIVVQDQMTALQDEIDIKPFATMPLLRAMLNVDTQDQLYVIPLPTAVFAGLLTLGGLGGYSRIRRR